MTLAIQLENLNSRRVRSQIGNNGVRRFAQNGLTRTDEENGLWNGFLRFSGFLISGVIDILARGLIFSFSAIFGLIVSTISYIWHFNWNASDAELDGTIQTTFNQLAGLAGGTLGNALGFLACGAVPGAVIFAFNEPLGLYILKNVGEEALEEIAANVASLIQQTSLGLMRVSIAFLYKNIRTLWRKPDNALKQQLEAAGVDPQKVNQAIAERNKPWSFAQTTEDLIESIAPQALENFTEELIEELFDACVEAGYVVASSLDSYFASQQIANQGWLGAEKTIEITLNRKVADNPDTE